MWKAIVWENVFFFLNFECCLGSVYFEWKTTAETQASNPQRMEKMQIGGKKMNKNSQHVSTRPSPVFLKAKALSHTKLSSITAAGS